MNDPIKCLIVDDEPLAINVIRRYVEQVSTLESVATCDNALDAFDILKQQTVDLIFLDIEMPLMNGIEFIKALQHPPSIIFTTAYRNYAIESYELNVVDYLLKPIAFPRFLQAIDKYLALRKTPQATTSSEVPSNAVSEAFIFVNTNKKFVKVVFDEIVYVESLKDYIRIHMSGKTIVTREKISVFQQQLPTYFLRIHRSFIINTKQLTAFSTMQVELGEKTLPIGNSYKRIVLDALQ